MIQRLIPLIILGAIACGLSLGLTPLARGLMRRLGAVDLPDPRRVNRVPVPRGGGLAVVAAFFATLAIGRWVFPQAFAASPFLELLPNFSMAAALLVGVGFLDDRKGLPPIVKLLAQVVAAGLMCWAGARLMLPTAWGAWTASPWVYIPLTLVWYIGVVNAFNLIDGLDGLSSGLAIIATIGMIGVLAFTHPAMVPMASVVFIGALLGFLRYNYNPASVFLGDCGSLFVGLTLATIPLVTHSNDAFLVSIGVPVLCLGVPLIDTSLAILRRTLRYVLHRTSGAGGLGASTMTADRDHVHHRFLTMAKGNQRRAVWGLYGLALALVALGFITLSVREGKASFFLVGFIAFATVIVRTMTNVEFWDAGRLLAKPGARNGSSAISAPIYILVDLLSMAGLYVLLLGLLAPLHPTNIRTLTWAHLFLAYSVPVAVGFVIIRSHLRIWGRSTRKDSAILIATIFVASLISHVGLVIVVPALAEQTRTLHIFWTLILPLPVLGARIFKSAFLQYLAFGENLHLRRSSLTDPSIQRVLFYGAGLYLRAYITLFEGNVTQNRATLLGVLDDNRGLRGRIFRDLPILGPLEVLEAEGKLAQLRPTHIVVTTPAIEGKRLADIRAFCARHHLTLSRFSVVEEPLRVDESES